MESDSLSVVNIGSSGKVLDELLKFFGEISDELIDSVEEVLEGSLWVKVNLSEVNDPGSPFGFSDLTQELLLIVGESLTEINAENGSNAQSND